MKHLEDLHQEILFNWAKWVKVRLVSGEVRPLIDFMYAIPNGGKRDAREAARLKKQGVKAGVSDIHLILPAGGYGGLWVELKRPIVKGKVKPSVQQSQKDWIETAESVGHKGLVAYGSDEAKAAIREYLGSMLVIKR